MKWLTYVKNLADYIHNIGADCYMKKIFFVSSFKMFNTILMPTQKRKGSLNSWVYQARQWIYKKNLNT